MFTIFDLIVLALAVHQAVNIYRYSSLFSSWREARDVGKPIAALPQSERVQAWARELLRCPWCFSVWVALAFTLIYWLLPFGSVLIIVLAASQLANFVHQHLDLFGKKHSGTEL